MKDELQKAELLSPADERQLSFFRITALWAFSESAFGGILHAFKIPFRGLFIASAAVLFISLIALFSKNNKNILKATLIVVLIKAIVSPYSPLTSYFAVTLQGFLGYLFFSTKKYFTLSALLLGIFVLFTSGFQKIIVLTIVFGNTLWETINIFIKQVSAEMFGINQFEINYGYLLIGIYISIHLVTGLFIGIYAGRLPQKIDHYQKLIPVSFEKLKSEQVPAGEKRKKKSWFLRPTGMIVIVVSTGVIILSYLSPKLEGDVGVSVVIMLIRSLVITFIWYTFLTPIVSRLFKKFVVKKQSKYSKDLEEIISMFPQFKMIVNYCWGISKDKKGLSRIRYFLSTSFYYLLLSSG